MRNKELFVQRFFPWYSDSKRSSGGNLADSRTVCKKIGGQNSGSRTRFESL